ncbi:MAG: ParB/RepB/Spo0J family partition protein [Shewanellaceae bacterium]|nr:ParB/RepB/Spo0J family partition protein [Shewanellaceae bacterium]
MSNFMQKMQQQTQGASQKISTSTILNAEKEFLVVDKHMLEIDPAQPRQVFLSEAIVTLQQSIELHGQLQPILTLKHGDKFKVVSGERRLRAIMASKMVATVKITVLRHPPTDLERLAIQIEENAQREDLKAIEYAQAVAHYHHMSQEQGLKREETCRQLQVSSPRLSKLLKVATTPSLIQDFAAQTQAQDVEALYLLTQAWEQDAIRTRAHIDQWLEQDWQQLNLRQAAQTLLDKIKQQTERSPTATPRVAKPALKVDSVTYTDQTLVFYAGKKNVSIELTPTAKMQLQQLLDEDAS